jgi:hypothetical protein
MRAMRAPGIFAVALLMLVPLACGGDDPVIDAMPPIDAEPPDAACVENPSCTAAVCDDVTGSYNTCATCPIVGMVGPFATTVEQCGCSLDGCIDGNCGMGCIDGDTLSFMTTIMGQTLNCTGTIAGGFSCTSALGNCTATWIGPEESCP